MEASVSGDFKNGGAGFSLEGQFNKLAEAASDISTLSISYTATAPLETVPTDISSLIKVINDFPRLVSSSVIAIAITFFATTWHFTHLSVVVKYKPNLRAKIFTELMRAVLE